MNQLVIIGNGFDLAHNMKTGYSDFMLWYLNKIIRPDREIRFFDADIDLVWLHYEFFNTSQYTDIGEALYYLNSKIRSVSFNKFFKKLIDNYNEAKWVDIEIAYFNELYALLESSIKSNTYLLDKHYIGRVKVLNSSLDLIKNNLEEYLSEVDKNDIACIPEIKTHLNDIFKLTGRNNTGESVHFLNFNYTSTLEKYFKEGKLEIDDKLFTINHIHGEINNKNNPVIFGYGDEMNPFYTDIENFNENELTRNLKSFHYLLSSNYQDLFDFIEEGEFDVTIMGHSCGLSDRVLMNSIFQHKNMKEIQIYYHNKRNGRYDNDFFEKTQNISRYFDSQSKHLMRYKIVPLSKCSPLVKIKSKGKVLSLQE